jgi:hypothetical protein
MITKDTELGVWEFRTARREMRWIENRARCAASKLGYTQQLKVRNKNVSFAV